MAGYRITENNEKKESILQMEGICPICGHYPSRYTEIKNSQKIHPTRQFKYICISCGSKWDGNIYDNNLCPV